MTLLTSTQAQELSRQLHDAHDTYKDPSFTHRRFKHRDIVPVIQQLGEPLSVSQVGTSLEGRSIHQVKAGMGSIPVLLWSQMHGDEATATMAMFDIFRFLQASGDGFDDMRQAILSKTTLYFVPMLNPDGAERFQRRTSADIDLNRDALRLQSPESVLLKGLQQSLKPLVGFNLHDQNPRYSVGNSGRQAVVSFLATAYDPARSVNDIRKRSMQLIVGMNRVLQQFIPGHVARYDDEFEPRAFGDNIQKWGTTLILIESGGQVGDPEKMSIRRLNFVAILTALHAIATESYTGEKTAEYQAIPENGRTLFDLLIRNATVTRNGKPYTVDLGINHYEVSTDSARAFSYRSTIEDLGDLSTFYGLREIDATGLTLTPARLHATTLDSLADLRKLDIAQLRQDGVVAFKVSKPLKKNSVPTYPVHVLSEGKLPGRPGLGQIPTFLLKKGSQTKYIFVNGFSDEQLGNGVVD
ncbi:M14 family zinc carboxypeptidase [Fibrella forsythiae]|uniref:Peptidase M14 n=1 Tax=Fibrella forsythiae TaxID=2817061 RepID=A0ABS3JJP9_9BACT|nr:M14 family zinc carboxypeptidase [Fibrella forsythiae]MBO0950217.1 peptidase M14 [Fibrella forsythiae]